MNTHVQYSRSQWGYLYLADVGCIFLAHLLALYAIYGRILHTPEVLAAMLAVMVMTQFVIEYGAGIYPQIFQRGRYRELLQCMKNTLALLAAVWAFLYFVRQWQAFPRRMMLFFSVFNVLFLFFTRTAVKTWLMGRYQHSIHSQKILLIAPAGSAKERLRRLQEQQEWMYEFTAVGIPEAEGRMELEVPVLYGLSAIYEYARSQVVDAVWVEISNRKAYFQEMIRQFEQMGISIYISIRGLDDTFHDLQMERIAGNTVLASSIRTPSHLTMVVKRAMDIAGAIVGLFFTGIAALIVGPLIVLESPGPVFFGQERVGLSGRRFRIYKFRSMYQDAEERKQELIKENEMAGHMFKMERDPRVTRIGRFIRRTSIDELPQFFNVLKGDMSLVGTRPPTVDEFEQYELHHRKRLGAKPGITGLWQVSGRNEITDFEEIVKLDAQYIRQFSISQDIYLLLKTIVVVFQRKGAK